MKKSESELKALIIIWKFLYFALLLYDLYNYKIQILEQIHEEFKLWQTVKVRSRLSTRLFHNYHF